MKTRTKLMNFFKKKNSLVEEIEDLEDGLEIFYKGKDTDTAHFEMVGHYGNNIGYERISISRRHNKRFIALVKEIIKETEQELEN